MITSDTWTCPTCAIAAAYLAAAAARVYGERGASRAHDYDLNRLASMPYCRTL